ncbi:MAG: hypothetical protein JO235_21380 [Chroococcidiopsidaceae cyanobacterium CP_BM_RX_35]|nr:hypothetical protein [Chroococcidiopsidaceae cyanobacterium CP_BM_RX_35]
MSHKIRRIRQYRFKGQSLTAAGKLHPERWKSIPKGEVARVLRENQGLSVKQVKKVHHLQHQICISYIDIDGNVCSSFFSYRLFESWQKAVESLIYTCSNLKELYNLRRIIQYDLYYFPYPSNIAGRISTVLESRFYELRMAA